MRYRSEDDRYMQKKVDMLNEAIRSLYEPTPILKLLGYTDWNRFITHQKRKYAREMKERNRYLVDDQHPMLWTSTTSDET